MINNLKYKIIQIFRNYSLPRWFVLVFDISAVFLSFLFAYMLRFNLELYLFSMVYAIKQAVFICLIYLIYMLLFKSYSGLLRQTTIKDTFKVAVTNSAAFTTLFLITLFSRKFELYPFFNIPLSILIIHYGSVTVSLIFCRIFIKMFYVFVLGTTSNQKNVLIYGSGETGIMVKRVLQSDPMSGYHLRGFI